MKKIFEKDSITLPFLFFFFWGLYLLIIFFVRWQDMWDHACFARQMLTGERPTNGNFIFFWLVNIFSGLSTTKIPSKISLCFLLACATTWRYKMAQEHIYKVLDYSKKYWSVLLGICMIFVFGIPIPSIFINGNFQLDSYVPNIWYNSTTIFVFPFALLLFELSYKQLINYSFKRDGWIVLLIFLNIFIKPSFFFVFIVTYPLFLLYKYRLNSTFWKALTPLIAGIIMLSFEYLAIYMFPHTASQNQSGVIFLPFYKNPNFLNNWQIPISLFFSLLFPIMYAFFNVSKIKKYKILVSYIVLSFFFSVLIFFLLNETGVRFTHRNFNWQIIICSWICFFVSLLSLVGDFKNQGITKKNKFLIFLFFIQVFIGIIYYIRHFIIDGYW